MNIDDFSGSFFEEAEELLQDMERLLLALDPAAPDAEELNAIFRAAHSIKGGAGAFGFSVLQHTTHVLENLLDQARHDTLALTTAIVDTLLQSRDVLQDQLNAYRGGVAPDEEAAQVLCRRLEQLGGSGAPAAAPAPVRAAPAPAVGSVHLDVTLLGVSEQDRKLLLDELALLGKVVSHGGEAKRYEIVLETNSDPDDISAVLCFIIEPEQVQIGVRVGAPPSARPEVREQQLQASAAMVKPGARQANASANKGGGNDASIRVPVGKVDSIINLVGELIIVQSMLEQAVQRFDGAALNDSLNLLRRNSRELQEAVMSVRMVQMDYVFSRFPRLVRDLAGKLGKDVELVTEGGATELDKNLIEGIIDPLTHLVRNSLDHGIETPDQRGAVGKSREGHLFLSARQQGGKVLIEVSDDGGGLRRQRLLDKARSKGIPVSDDMSDQDVWQLIFAPGFSTAEQVSDVSGRGVGMDVVRRNIQGLGGHVEIESQEDAGTTVRIVLPLTLAILDAMTLRVAEEIFVLPLVAIQELLRPVAKDLYTMAGEDLFLRVRDDYLPVLALRDLIGLEAVTRIEDCVGIIVEGDGRRYVLLIDEPLGQQQVVVKSLENNYRKLPGIAAATILGDGRVALILDAEELRRVHQGRQQRRSALVRQAQRMQQEPTETEQ
jgi:two-component system chemotaxis sensor kinase CheA